MIYHFEDLTNELRISYKSLARFVRANQLQFIKIGNTRAMTQNQYDLLIEAMSKCYTSRSVVASGTSKAQSPTLVKRKPSEKPQVIRSGGRPRKNVGLSNSA